jgi:hypothetical protein
MVSAMILSRYQEGFPGNNLTDNERRVGGPLYLVDEVIELLNSSTDTRIIPMTKKCIKDIRDLALDQEDQANLIVDVIKHGQFRNSEWCELKNPGTWAACDAYRLERIECFGTTRCPVVYVKFAIGTTGKILLLVSCHT